MNHCVIGLMSCKDYPEGLPSMEMYGRVYYYSFEMNRIKSNNHFRCEYQSFSFVPEKEAIKWFMENVVIASQSNPVQKTCPKYTEMPSSSKIEGLAPEIIPE